MAFKRPAATPAITPEAQQLISNLISRKSKQHPGVSPWHDPESKKITLLLDPERYLALKRECLLSDCSLQHFIIRMLDERLR